jgi:glutamate 5-kinase
MTLVVKLGSSIVADDDGELRTDVLDSVCQQVASIEQSGERVVMVTSGAIARGMRLMEIESRPKAMDELQAASAVGQGDLFRAYEQRLLSHKTRAAQVLLTRIDIRKRAHYGNARQTLERLIHWGVVPVINENDTTATEEISFGDNDFLAAQIAVFLRAQLLVLLTNTEGVYSSDPRFNESARLIPRIEDFGQLRSVEIGHRPSAFGRGGMGSKVAAAEMASRSNVEVVICNGTRPQTLLKAIDGLDIGTRFPPMPRKGKKPSIFKLWLKYATEPKGALYIDAGAAEKLRHSGSSLLPVGIIDTAGGFAAGDVVAVIGEDHENELIGHGMAEYSAFEVQQIMGQKSVRVRDQFPGRPPEVVHRDRFALV